MRASLSRRRWLRAIGCAVCAAAISGCGTLLYPERRGQPAGPLDWKVVALNGIGLLFFFVPGVIAFAVDFINGTIYLPPDQYGATGGPGQERELVSIAVPPRQLSRTEIERQLSRHLDRPVELRTGTYATSELADLGDFWKTWDTHRQAG